MSVGTKSLLFGVHCFFLHPIFVAWAWLKLFGWTWDPRIWTAFVVHDWGYWGKPNMDGPEGETHVELGARIMGILFDGSSSRTWHDFSLLHSRFYAKKMNRPFSRLAVADKLAIVLTPDWLYMPMARWSGELEEYMEKGRSARHAGENQGASDAWVWRQRLKTFVGTTLIQNMMSELSDEENAL